MSVSVALIAGCTFDHSNPIGQRDAAIVIDAAIDSPSDAAIVPEAVGGVIGGGTGRRYSYIDLSLTDVKRAAELMRPALRKGRIPPRTWLMFFDDELADEWVGIGEGGGPPPKREER